MRGAWLVLGMLLLAAIAGVLAIVYQQQSARQATAYWGIDQALRIRDADRVDFGRLSSATASARVTSESADAPPGEDVLVGQEGERWLVSHRQPVDSVPGFSHLRHALLQDESYVWSQPADPSAASAAHALLFEGAGEPVVILLDVERALVRDARQSEWRSVAPIAPFLRRFFGPLLKGTNDSGHGRVRE